MERSGLGLQSEVVEGVQVLHVSGELDVATEDAFRAYLDGDAAAAGSS